MMGWMALSQHLCAKVGLSTTPSKKSATREGTMKPQTTVMSVFRAGLISFLAVALIALISLPSAQAADEKVAWYQVLSVKFKVGKADEAVKIIHEHFWKVDKTTGRKMLP